MHQEAGGANPNTDRGAGRERLGLGSRRVIWVAFAVSAALHLGAIVLYPALSRAFAPEGASFRLPEFAGRPQGIEVIRLVEVADPIDPERPEDPDEIEEVEQPEVTPAPITFEGRPGPDLTPPPLSGAERLRPRLNNPDLWAPLAARITDLSLEQRERILIANVLETWNDSVAQALSAEAAAMDWTFTDKDGKKWGISPGQIHLGDVTLPMPFEFGTAIGKRDEVNDRLRVFDEIMRQGARLEVNESWRDRAEAIRRRRDRERAEAKPDTSRIRR
jgi:hypothetical protein